MSQPAAHGQRQRPSAPAISPSTPDQGVGAGAAAGVAAGVTASTERANRRSEKATPRANTGRTSRKPTCPSSPSGKSNHSDHTNRLPPPGSGCTSKAPVPRTSRPVCRTRQRYGGSQVVISMVSANPNRPMPVTATVRAPTPRPSRYVARTTVPSTHSDCRSQSTTAAHTAAGGASISTDSTISATVRSLGGFRRRTSGVGRLEQRQLSVAVIYLGRQSGQHRIHLIHPVASHGDGEAQSLDCLLYTSPSPRDRT